MTDLLGSDLLNKPIEPAAPATPATPALSVPKDTQTGLALNELLDHVPEMENHPDAALAIAKSDSPDKIGLAQGTALAAHADGLQQAALEGTGKTRPGGFWDDLGRDVSEAYHGIAGGISKGLSEVEQAWHNDPTVFTAGIDLQGAQQGLTDVVGGAISAGEHTPIISQ